MSSSPHRSGQTPKTANTVWHPTSVERDVRWDVAGGPGQTIWLTGLSGSGKSTVAVELEQLLLGQGRLAYLLDGDNLRHGLNGDLGFSSADRQENVRRVAHVARLFADAGLVSIVPLISPFQAGRDQAKAIHHDAGIRFVEVFVDTPLAECEKRDPKGLYRKARRGELTQMTGIDAPYEAPTAPDLRLTPAHGSPIEMAETILAL